MTCGSYGPGVIDPTSDRAVYRQIADVLRARIRSGEIQAGQMLYEGRIGQEFEVGRGTARRAVQLLRTEGLLVTESGYGSRVVAPPERRQQVRVPRAARIIIRMPTDDERQALGIEPGAVVPVAVIHVGAQTRGPYAGDRTEFTTA